ncbi:MAG: tetratricopeptide repeat protein [Spirulina sp. SIO3F2]|nr:tetratricopeptide repeat protein [Spirulina sp. SIO3F2]
MIKKVIGGLLLAAGLGVAGLGLKPWILPNQTQPTPDQRYTLALLSFLSAPLGAAGTWLLLVPNSQQKTNQAATSTAISKEILDDLVTDIELELAVGDSHLSTTDVETDIDRDLATDGSLLQRLAQVSDKVIERAMQYPVARFDLTPQEMSALCQLGGHDFCIDTATDQEIPVFTFIVEDISTVKALFQDMYVNFDIRWNSQGKLAFHLDVPDRNMIPWAIPINPTDMEHLQQGAAALNLCLPIVQNDQGESIDLKKFAWDVTYDWSQTYAQAHQAFTENSLTTAKQLLLQCLAENPQPAPAVYHLLGRSVKGLGELDQAIDYYVKAIALTRDATGTTLLPKAAGILSDLGVAFKQKGDLPRAIHCFLHSLTLRPNHPAALITFATLFTRTPGLMTYCLARVMVIDPRNAWLPTVIQNCARSVKLTPEQLLTRVRLGVRWAEDLSHWPLARPELKTYQSFKAGLDDARRVAKKPHASFSSLG